MRAPGRIKTGARLTMFSVKQLYDLQLLDWDVQKRERTLVEVRDKIADDSELTGVSRKLTEIEARLEELGAPRRRSEVAIEQHEQRMDALNKRAYSGVITTPREMSAYEEEKAGVEQKRAEEEDTLLDLLVTIEGLQAEREQAREASNRISARREEELPVLRAREVSISSELPGLYDRRQKLVGEFPPQVTAVYENIRKTRDGQAVALVERGMCQACRITLPSTELQQARISQKIVHCDSCGRILVMT